MALDFDLVSDLYLEDTSGINWYEKATSLFCIVAGNISSDRVILLDFLNKIKDYYRLVFFLDGELEHTKYSGDFETSYTDLKIELEKISNVIYLHETIVVLNNISIVGTNGWTTFNFINAKPVDQNIVYLDENNIISKDVSNEIIRMAIGDRSYLHTSIDTCQTMEECDQIIVVTNTVPDKEFIGHRKEYDGTIFGDIVGNSGIIDCLKKDIHRKVKIWAFGNFDDNLDFIKDGIRFTSNPKFDREMDIYYPKRIIL